MAVNITAINTAINDTLAAATGLTFTQDYDELTESVVELPLLQVYWAGTESDIDSDSDRTTFGKGLVQSRFVFNADLYGSERMDIGMDFGEMLPIVDAIHNILDAQNDTTPFGLATIKTLEKWSANMVIFEYAGFEYLGARFQIPIRVF